jgi:hypothetical protein
MRVPAPEYVVPAFTDEHPVPDFSKSMLPFTAPATDHPDLEKADDLEGRATRRDREQAARDSLKAMGLVLPQR